MALTPVISDFPPSPIRNNYTGSAGYKFSPLSDLTISHLGRPVGSVFAQSHTINVWRESTQQLIASATVNAASSTVDGYAIAELGTPVNLLTGVYYLILSDEFDQGDNWQDEAIPTGVSGISVFSHCYGPLASFPPNIAKGGTRAYVWPNMYTGGGSSNIAHVLRSIQQQHESMVVL